MGIFVQENSCILIQGSRFLLRKLFLGAFLFIILPFILSAASIDHSALMPPVGNQGDIGSCASWATAYYYKGFQENKEHPGVSHQFSPSFIYNELVNGQDTGSTFEDNFDLISRKGCAALTSMPYTSDLSVLPNKQQCIAAMPYRINGYSEIDATLYEIKRVLDSGNIVVIGIEVFTDFLSLSETNSFYDGPSYYSVLDGFHAITVVGYDDSKNGIGAFKLYNSWGSSWGDEGIAWISYMAMSRIIDDAWTMTDRIGYTPEAYITADIAHTYRNQLKVYVARGSSTSSIYYRELLFYRTGGSYDNISTAYDITDQSSHLPPDSTNKWYLEVADAVGGYSGRIDSFTLYYNGKEYNSNTTLPCFIPDPGNTYAFIDGTYMNGNRPPSKPSVTISPSNPVTTDSLTCNTYGSADPDGDTVYYKYAWFRNGIAQTSISNNIVDHVFTLKGDTWLCEVIPYDGSLEGIKASAQVVILNSPPTKPEVNIVPANPLDSDNLTCSASASYDADGDVVVYKYMWYKNAYLQAALTTNVVSASLTQINDVWSCTVTPSDSSAYGPSNTASVVILQGNIAPTKPLVIINPENPRTTETLVCTASGSIDPNGDTVTYIYAWYKNSVSQSQFTGNTISSEHTSKGENWKCEVIATDGLLSGPASGVSVDIQNSIPTIATVSIIPTAPTFKDDLTCKASGSTDADNDTITYKYTWYKNDQLQASLTGSTVPYIETQEKEIWKCVVTPTDGSMEGEISEASVTISGKLEDLTVNVSFLLIFPDEQIIPGEPFQIIARAIDSYGSVLSSYNNAGLRLMAEGATIKPQVAGVINGEAKITAVVEKNFDYTEKFNIWVAIESMRISEIYTLYFSISPSIYYKASGVFPNPVHSGGTVEFSGLVPGSDVKLFDISGGLIREAKSNGSSWHWDLKNFSGAKIASGVYIYLIKSGSAVKKGKIAVLK